MKFANRKRGLPFYLTLFLLLTSMALHAQPLASITGTVKDAQGRPLGGAVVILSSSGVKVAALRTVSDPEGAFAFHGLNYGPYTLSVESIKEHAKPREVLIASPTTKVDLILATSAETTGIGGPKTTGSAAQAPPAFAPAGIHGTIAPSGYSSGLSSEETAQVLNHMSDFTADLISAYVPTEADAGCGREAELIAAVQADPSGFNANHALGLFYLVHGDAKKSLRYLKQSFAAEPEDVGNARDLAVAMIMASQYGDAVPLLENLAAKNKTDPTISRLLALSYAALGDIEKSRAEYLHASTVDPGADNLFACGVGLIGVGKSSDAEQLLSAAIQANPASAKLWMGLGIAQDIQQRKKEAVQSFLKAVDLDPQYIPPYSFLAESDVSPDADLPIRQRLAALVAAKPDSAEAHYDYALALAKEHAPGASGIAASEIQAQLRRAIELDPAMTRAHFQLGVVLADFGVYANAVAEFEEVVKLQPDNAEAHYRLAQAYRREQKTEQANLEMTRFLELHGSKGTSNDNPESDLQRVLLQQSSGKTNDRSCHTRPD